MRNGFAWPPLVAALALALGGLPWGAGPGSAWAEADRQVAVQATRAGELKLVQKGQERLLFLEGRVVDRGSDLMSLVKFLSTPAYDAVLVKDYGGPVHCPAELRFLAIQADGAVRESPPLWHCHPKPAIHGKGNTVSVEFPAFGSDPAVIFTFDGRELKSSIQRLPH